MIESYIRQKLATKDILLMTHIVMGYPSFEVSYKIVEAMVEAGVDLMELQIPFSEPIADGPVILCANQKALEKGATASRCLSFARDVTRRFDIPFLFMTYYNILFKHGVAGFVRTMAENGIQGAIIPDLPPEEAGDYLDAMAAHALSPIFIFSPATAPARMTYISGFGKGFIYCVARKGVTGLNTDFSRDLEAYLARCRSAADLPLAVGFGVKEKADVDFLKRRADIAVIGTQTIRLVDDQGADAVGDFIRSLR